MEIKKTYELKSVATSSGKPVLEIAGSGSFTFDLKLGAPSKSDFRETIISRDGNTTTEIPLTISSRLLTDDELKRVVASGGTGTKLVATKQQLDEQERTAVLADLNSGDQNKYLRRLLQLQNIAPAEPDDEMAAAIATTADNDKNAVRFSAFRALENWATEENIDLLIQAMDDEFTPVQTSAIKTLGRLKAKEAIEPLAKKVANLQTRTTASATLSEFGTDAEQAVLKLLTHDEWTVRAEACQILNLVGTSKSVAALEKALEDENALVRQRAKTSFDAIKERDEK